MNQTVFITGIAGFIGSHLSELLLKQGYRVIGLDNLSTGSVDNIASLMDNPNFHFARADIDCDLVVDRMASQADTIIHLAAAVGVELIVDRPVQTIETNIMGTEKILKAALRYDNRVLIASTSEVYGKGIRMPFAEDDDVVLGPTSKHRWAYAASKMVDEFLGLAYHHEYGLEVIPFRLFNTVGPRQSGRYGMVIPRFVRWALANEPIRVYGDGLQTRCFCHVFDIIRGIQALMESKGGTGSVHNIGGLNEISMLALAEMIKEMTGSQSEIKMIPYDEAYSPGFEDMRQRRPDISRMKKSVDWEPRRDLQTILQDVIDFERSRI
ncbi:MAG: GDP-mannose 4,6-dehydratase [Lentisphaeria bacterium]|nr:GDP-mannose 4,6-dehydratase [Lentisphaeria bacterium]